AACPYHVIGFNEKTGLAQKCTFCYSRLQQNLIPACAKACPTESIKFGELTKMREVAASRVAQLQAQGVSQAQLYGDKEYGGLHALFLLMDKPEVYGLPNADNAVLPRRNNFRGYLGAVVTAVIGLVGAVIAFRDRGGKEEGEAPALARPPPRGGGFSLGFVLSAGPGRGPPRPPPPPPFSLPPPPPRR